jgi:hypothetical protein
MKTRKELISLGLISTVAILFLTHFAVIQS